ncbi:MAG: hypothetical protein AMXMBFR67_23540 [Nitrospira sp.]
MKLTGVSQQLTARSCTLSADRLLVAMPYETLIDALLEEGRAKSEAILRKAQAEAERLLNDVKRKSEALDHEVDSLLHRDLSAQRTAILSRAALSGRHVLQQVKQEVLDEVWRHASQKAMTLTGNVRTNVLTALLDEVLFAFSSPTPCVLIESRERPYVEDILKERRIHFKEQHQDDLLLGIKLEADGQVLTNSFATRLVKAKPELMIELNRLLFADGGQQSALSNQSSGKS